MNKTVIKYLESPQTVGELRKVIEPFDNEMSFGFRNQPMQDLVFIDYGTEKFLVFQEQPEDNTIDKGNDRPKWLMHIMQSIYEMRLAQKEYYKSPCDTLLRIAKHKESIVDNTVKDGITKGYITEKENHKSEPLRLF